MVRTKKINNLSNSGNKSTKQKVVANKSVNNNTSSHNNNIIRPNKFNVDNNDNNNNKGEAAADFSRVINVTAFRNIPYESFILRLTPYDKETYLKMIMEIYCPRIEISVSISKPIKYIIDILTEKWKSISKSNSKYVLHLLPIEDIWLPKQLTEFSSLDNTNSFDIGDVYTSYGNPSTNILYMYYQWVEVENDAKAQLEIVNNLMHPEGMIDTNTNLNKNKLYVSNMNENQLSNCAMKNDNSFEVDISDDEDEEEELEQEKSFMPLESDLNIFDPLEFLGFEDDKKNSNSSDDEDEGNMYYGNTNNNKNNKPYHNNNNKASINHFPSKNIFITKKEPRCNSISKSSGNSGIHHNNNNININVHNNNNNGNNTNNNNNNNNNQNKNHSKLRTDYSELFTKSDCGLLLTNKSNHNTTNQMMNNNNNNNTNLSSNEKQKTTKRKIPFTNNVNKDEIQISDQFNTSLRNLNVLSSKTNSTKDNFIEGKKNDNESNIINHETNTKRRIQPSIIQQSSSNNNINRNSMHYPTNFGFSALFQPDPNTKMLNNINNNTNLVELNNNQEISNLLNQHSLNLNSIFEYPDNNTNIDMFKPNYNMNTNIYKMEYHNNNSNYYHAFGHNNNNNNNNNNQIYKEDENEERYHNQEGNGKYNNNNTEANEKDNKDNLLNKKKKRNIKEKKTREKITIEEIEESEKKLRLKRVNNTKPQNLQQQQSPSACIINHNNFFNFPGQYYPQITSANMGIPLPSNFFKEQNHNEN